VKPLRRVLLVISKVLLAIALGWVALLVAHIVLGFLFGALQGLFGWPIPTTRTTSLILLAVFVLCLLLYGDRRRTQRSVVESRLDDPDEILAARKHQLTAVLESRKQVAEEKQPTGKT
jgi:hypothetical protein